MQCPNCHKTWPDEFKVCPICATGLKAELGEEASGAIAQGPGAKAAGERGVAIGGDVSDGIIVTGDNSAVGRRNDEEGDE